ncbi:SH3 domain-containing protein [Mesorhizobium sp. M1066]
MSSIDARSPPPAPPAVPAPPPAVAPQAQPNSSSIAYAKPDAVATQKPNPATLVRWLYTTKKVRVRVAPDTGARIITTLPLGDLVQTNGQQGDWYNVTVSARIGWIHGDYLSQAEPVELTSTTPVAPAAASDDGTVSEHAAGDPVRAPVVGRCDCPYDLMRNGRLCGGRSAYSRPGGRSPVCYW